MKSDSHGEWIKMDIKQETEPIFPQLTEPTYWHSYEYKQMQQEMEKLNEKMDLILSLLQKKQRKCTITEVNKKMDNLIEMMKM